MPRTKRDRALVSKEPHEPRTLLKKWAIDKETLDAVKDLVGKGRAKIEAYLKEKGYKLRSEIQKDAGSKEPQVN